MVSNKKIFQISDFCFQLQAVLVETMPSRSRRSLFVLRAEDSVLGIFGAFSLKTGLFRSDI